MILIQVEKIRRYWEEKKTNRLIQVYQDIKDFTKDNATTLRPVGGNRHHTSLMFLFDYFKPFLLDSERQQILRAEDPVSEDNGPIQSTVFVAMIDSGYDYKTTSWDLDKYGREKRIYGGWVLEPHKMYRVLWNMRLPKHNEKIKRTKKLS